MLIPFSDLFRKYNIQPTGVFHIGASEGQEAAEYVKNGIRSAVWIEAIAEVFKKLELNVYQYPQLHSTCIQACVSDIDGQEVEFNIANNDGQSSSMLQFGTHTAMHPTVKFVDKRIMITRTVKTVIEYFKLDMTMYDFLNIDLQGAELLALKGMGDYITGFRYAYIEVNRAELYKGCPLVEDIDAYLATFGFIRVETKWTGWGWGDAFYKKTIS